jgi:hypothetical protein
MADTPIPHPSMRLAKMDRSYAAYAGFYTDRMRQRAIEAGCRTVAEMEEWFDFNYGQDRNMNDPPRDYPGRKIPFTGRAAKLHKIRLIP